MSPNPLQGPPKSGLIFMLCLQAGFLQFNDSAFSMDAHSVADEVIATQRCCYKNQKLVFKKSCIV
jgi:hypothetical protein